MESPKNTNQIFYFTAKGQEELCQLDEKAQFFLNEIGRKHHKRIKYLCICLDLLNSCNEGLYKRNEKLIEMIKKFSLYDPLADEKELSNLDLNATYKNILTKNLS